MVSFIKKIMIPSRYLLIIILLLGNICQAQFHVANGSFLHVESGHILYFDKDVDNEGLINFVSNGELILDQGLVNSSGTLTLNNAILKLGSGTARADGTHTLTFNDSDDTVNFVELEHNGTFNVSSTGFLKIVETFTSNSGTLNAADRIVLLSGTEPAYMNHNSGIDEYPDTAIVPQSAGGSVNDLRIQKYFPGNRAWRFLSSPVKSNLPINDNWQEGAVTVAIGSGNPNPGYGTHITGGPSGNGFDQNESGNFSMFTYNNSMEAWTVSYPTSTNTAGDSLQVGRNYYTLVRGDRAVNLQINDFTTEEPTILRSTGNLHIGNFSTSHSSITTGEYFATGNPYQAPVDMNAVRSTSSNSFTDEMWVWQPLANNDGQYAHISNLGGTITNSLPGSFANQYIQPFQAVFIQANTNNPVIAYQETHKSTDTNLVEVFSMTTPDNYLRIGLYGNDQAPFIDVAHDGLVMLMNNTYNTTTTKEDGEKFFNTEENMAIQYGDRLLTLDKRNFPTDYDEVVDLYMFNLDEGNYKLSIDLTGYDNLPNGIFLWDKYNDTYTSLSNGLVIPISFDQAIPESIDENRFALTFKDQTLSTDNLTNNDQIKIFPNAFNDKISLIFDNNFTGETIYINMFDIIGRRIYSEKTEIADNILELKNLDFSSGNYLLKIKSENYQQTFKVVKK
jgi:hypothetical protein